MTPLEDPEKLLADLAASGAADLEALLRAHLRENREILSRAGMQQPDVAGASNSAEVIQRLAVMAQAFIGEGGSSVTARVRGAADMLAAVAAVWGVQQLRLQGGLGADQAAREAMAGILLGMATVFLRHEERGIYPEWRKARGAARQRKVDASKGGKTKARNAKENPVRLKAIAAWEAYRGNLSLNAWSIKEKGRFKKSAKQIQRYINSSRTKRE